jgi:uncharacterized phage protein (TIGR02218 family)
MDQRAEIAMHRKAGPDVIVTLLEAPLRALAPAQSFLVRAGCDKRIGTCTAKFANAASFRGFPHIRGQDTVIRYATRDGGNTGEVL